MAKNESTKRKSAAVAAPALPAAVSPVVFLAGILLLDVAALAALLLVFDHFGGLSLPGCGKGSPCAQAAASYWGKVPATSWPISFVGLAYFTALTVAWGVARGVASPPLRLVAAVGGVMSLFYVTVLLTEGHYCYYCLAVHAANVAFVGLLLLGGRRRVAPPAADTLVLLGVFLGVSGVLAGAEMTLKKSAAEKAERDLAESTARIVAPKPAGDDVVPTTTRPLASSTTSPAPAPVTAPTTAAFAPPGFTGRYRFGPESAAVRIVLFTDYQCPDCLNIESQIRQVLQQRTDASLSVKHFPFCTACNPGVPNLHANACWAARAAEAAGILWGDAGFFKVHHWLFDRRGKFESSQELNDGIRSLGFDPTGFEAIMSGPETLSRVQADVAEAIALGIYFTPMIFINGVELKGWQAPSAVLRAVDALVATNPVPATSAADRAPLAAEKYVADWRDQTPIALPARARVYARGAPDAPASIVVFGDYLEPITVSLDQMLSGIAAGRSDIRYEFRLFPVDQKCNNNVDRTIAPNSCRAAAAAEAAGIIGGAEGFWKIHAWLMANSKSFDDPSLRAAAVAAGLDPDKLIATIDSPEVKAAIAADLAAAVAGGIRNPGRGIPMLFINNRLVPRFKLEGGRVVERIIAEATGKP